MSRDTIGDFLTIIRNGVARSRPFIVAPHSRINADIAHILKDEGFVRDVHTVTSEETGHPALKVMLKYVDGESSIHAITRKSTPGRRVYTNVNGLEPVIGGLGVAILTTNKGVLSHKKATELGVGGELLCTVW